MKVSAPSVMKVYRGTLVHHRVFHPRRFCRRLVKVLSKRKFGRVSHFTYRERLSMSSRGRPRDAEIPMIPELGDARLASQFEARFTISPPVCKAGTVFTCDVVLVDQFGEEHTAKGVQFQPVGGPAWENMRKQERSQRLQKIAEKAVERTKKEMGLK